MRLAGCRADAFFQFPTSKYGLALITGASAAVAVGWARTMPRAMLLSAEKADRRDRTAHRNGERIGTLWPTPRPGAADRQAGTTGYPARQAGRSTTTALSRKRGRAHKELFDKAWGSQMSSFAAARMEKRPPKFRALTVMVRRAPATGGSVPPLAAGTTVAQAYGTPAALGADAASIRASEQSPNYRDGATFANLIPRRCSPWIARFRLIGVVATQCESQWRRRSRWPAEYLLGDATARRQLVWLT